MIFNKKENKNTIFQAEGCFIFCFLHFDDYFLFFQCKNIYFVNKR